MPTTDCPISVPAGINKLLIVGASARQTAQSAVAAGFDCVAIDLFGDWDLRNIAQTFSVTSLDDLQVLPCLQLLDHLPDQFLISGGMEKRPKLIDDISKFVPYLGTPVEQIIRTNDPFEIRQVCQSNGIPFPEIRQMENEDDDQSTGAWLRKPFASAGGTKVGHWSADRSTRSAAPVLPPLSKDNTFYLQRFVPGKSFSALFFNRGDATELIGSTRQLIGQPVFTRNEFCYCGSIGPVDFELPTRVTVERFGRILAEEFGMQGVFGLDLVVEAGGNLWLIEINPRITASAEIFELSGMVSSIARTHVDAATGRNTEPINKNHSVVGKSILFSDFRDPLIIDEQIHQYLAELNVSTCQPRIADIPCVGTVIDPGQPILTLFQIGDSDADILSKLEDGARRLRHRLKKLEAIVASS